jgi:hypothetical protein
MSWPEEFWQQELLEERNDYQKQELTYGSMSFSKTLVM